MESASVSPARVEVASGQEQMYVDYCRVRSVEYAGYRVVVYAV